MSKEYRDTLNLPQTDLSMKAGLPKKNQKFLHFGIRLISIMKSDNKIMVRNASFFMMGLHMQMETFI